MKKTKITANSRRLVCFLLCLCMLLGAISLSSCNSSADDDEELVEAIRVIDDINVGGKFTNDRLETVKVRASTLPEGTVSKIEVLRNKFAAVKLYAGDYVTLEKTCDEKPVEEPEEQEEVKNEIDARALGYVIITDYAELAIGGSYSDAIDEAIKQNPNKTIYFPDRVYAISRPIDIPADPAKAVSFRLSNNAVLQAHGWEEPNTTAVIRVGYGEVVEPHEITADEYLKNGASCYITGGCINASSLASGISVENGSDVLIYNVSIKNAFYGIHLKPGKNADNAGYVNIDNVNVTGFEAIDSVGVLVESRFNNISNMRIASIQYGVVCSESGSDNVLRNIHPLVVGLNGVHTVGFWDKSDGNIYDVCYSDQFSTGFLMESNTRSVYNGCFCFWWSGANNYHVGFRSNGQFNSIVSCCKVSHSHANLETDAYLLVGEDGGQGVVLYPANHVQDRTHDNVLEQYCPTGGL